MPVVIRSATESDSDIMLRMFGALDDLHTLNHPEVFCGASERPRPREFIAGLLSAPDCAVLIAELERRVVGQVVIRLRESSDHPLLVRHRYGQIDDLFVCPEARRQGVGQALIRAAEAWARQSGVDSVELVVWEFNEPAHRLYRAHGYSTQFRRMRRVLPPGT